MRMNSIPRAAVPEMAMAVNRSAVQSFARRDWRCSFPWLGGPHHHHALVITHRNHGGGVAENAAVGLEVVLSPADCAYWKNEGPGSLWRRTAEAPQLLAAFLDVVANELLGVLLKDLVDLIQEVVEFRL